MNELMNNVTVTLSDNLGLDFETAQKITSWFETEGFIDYDTVKEIYQEPNA